jgi:hypothetical protein
MKILKLLRKEYPELKLQLELIDDYLVFTGYQTPSYLIEGGQFYREEINQTEIRYSSLNSPELRMSYFSDSITLFIGGDSINDFTFRKEYCIEHYDKGDKNILNKLFRNQHLNKNVKVL